MSADEAAAESMVAKICDSILSRLSEVEAYDQRALRMKRLRRRPIGDFARKR
jgi:uncharacterized protein YlaI